MRLRKFNYKQYRYRLCPHASWLYNNIGMTIKEIFLGMTNKVTSSSSDNLPVPSNLPMTTMPRDMAMLRSRHDTSFVIALSVPYLGDMNEKGR